MDKAAVAASANFIFHLIGKRLWEEGTETQEGDSALYT